MESIKKICNLVVCEGNSLVAPDGIGGYTFISLHETAIQIIANQRLLDDSEFDVDAWLSKRIADKFMQIVDTSFMSGDGMDRPRGFLSYDAVPNNAWDWGSLGYIATGEAGDFSATNPADAVVDLIYALGARYRVNATFVMNLKTAVSVMRKMADADGRFLWSDGLASGEPARLMGFPVLIDEGMPDIAEGAYAIAFGDFSNGYTIAECPDINIMRDDVSAKPNILFCATKRVGGDVSDFAAIKLLKFSKD